MNLSGEMLTFCLGFVTTIFAVVWWVAGLQASVKSNAAKISEILKMIEKNEIRIEKLEGRHEALNNEIRTIVLSIYRSISTVQGKLGIDMRGE